LVVIFKVKNDFGTKTGYERNTPVHQTCFAAINIVAQRRIKTAFSLTLIAFLSLFNQKGRVP